MELKFIWIKDYGLIKALGVNFNHANDYTFSYDGRKLLVNSRSPNILNFGKNINGVTAVAGQNGSGKSSLCQVVLLSTATYTNGLFGYDMTFNGIVCYDNHIFYHKDLILENNEELLAKGFIISEYEKSPLENISFELKRGFVSGGFIYYSNMFDFASTFDGVNLKNISSANLIYEEARYTSAYFRQLYDSHSYLPKDHLTEPNIFQIEQGNKHVKYYLEEYDYVPFTGPAYIILKSSYSDNNRWLQFSEKASYDQHSIYNEIQNEIFRKIYQYKSTAIENHNLEISMTNETIKDLINKLYRLNMLRAHAVSTGIYLPEKEIYGFVYDKERFNVEGVDYSQIFGLADIHNLLSDMSTYLEDFTFKPYSMNSYYENRLEDWRFILLENMYVPNTDAGRSLLLEFLNAEHIFMNQNLEGGIRKITNVKFTTFFSSGEQAYLSLFSRLHETIKLYAGEHHQKENLTIFIDEGDAGFHPKWNKQYFKWVLDFLNRRPEKLKYQLIFSTHSPYLLSDLTSENVLLLRRGSENKTEIVPTSEFESFGANIYELLANNFFLDDGTIGEFAKTEINKVIDNLNEWRKMKIQYGTNALTNILAEHKSNALTLITNIADYIVRGKLFEIYSEIFEDENIKENEISYLEQRIKKLKGR